MVKTISQKVTFKNTTPDELYDLYMDSDKHSIVTGATATLNKKAGEAYMTYDNYVTGKNLQLITGKLIVQTWRASDWGPGDVDSTFILLFEKNGKDTIVYMTHANLPERQASDLKQGWIDFW